MLARTESAITCKLTKAERRVLAFSACGYTKKETARYLWVSSETIKEQRQTIIRKLQARNMLQAVSIAFRLGELTHERLGLVEHCVAVFESRIQETENRANHQERKIAA